MPKAVYSTLFMCYSSVNNLRASRYILCVCEQLMLGSFGKNLSAFPSYTPQPAAQLSSRPCTSVNTLDVNTFAAAKGCSPETWSNWLALWTRVHGHRLMFVPSLVLLLHGMLFRGNRARPSILGVTFWNVLDCSMFSVAHLWQMRAVEKILREPILQLLEASLLFLAAWKVGIDVAEGRMDATTRK